MPLQEQHHLFDLQQTRLNLTPPVLDFVPFLKPVTDDASGVSDSLQTFLDIGQTLDIQKSLRACLLPRHRRKRLQFEMDKVEL